MYMNNINTQRWHLVRHFFAAGALLAMATCAHAQYVWIDEKGLKQFSDRPPPAATPMKRILKAPGGVPKAAEAANDAATDASAPAESAPAAKGPPTLAERDAEYRKHKAEKAAKDQKAMEEARSKADKLSNCDAARQNKVTLDSGVRMAVVDKNGERGYMNDEQRTQETARANKALADCK